MLIVLQFPLGDLRTFRSSVSRREYPHWPAPDAGREFVRFFGPVRERRHTRKRNPLPWSDEQFFVDAARALKLVPFNGERAKWSCAFRRLLSDGGAVVRFEVAFDIPSTKSLAPPPPILDTVATVLETPCIVRGDKNPIKLILISQRVAKLYARATTPRGTPAKDGEVVAGQPTVLVQFEDGDNVSMPKWLDFDSEKLAFMKSAHSGITMNIWFTSAKLGEPRNTRTALLRLSAEHQCLKFVLRDIAAGNVQLDRQTPETEKLQRYLASTDRTLSQATRFGVDQTDLIRLTQTYETLCGGTELDGLRQRLNEIRPQIRTKVMALVDAAIAQQPPEEQIGPSFRWQGEFAETEYQAFFQSGRQPMAVAWLTDVMNLLCPAVCLIRLPALQRPATGFLVANDLILTNWHVLEFSPSDDIDANLSDMELYFTRSAQADRVFKLAVANGSRLALVTGSPVAKLDFVLLRIAEDVASTLNVKPISCNADSKPVPHQGIHIIQHPGGGPLMISVDENGVTGVYPNDGTVQYISKAQGGSSGSPCIDGSRQLVAIHHAAKSTSFCSIREGIMLSAIYPEIARYLPE